MRKFTDNHVYFKTVFNTCNFTVNYKRKFEKVVMAVYFQRELNLGRLFIAAGHRA